MGVTLASLQRTGKLPNEGATEIPHRDERPEMQALLEKKETYNASASPRICISPDQNEAVSPHWT